MAGVVINNQPQGILTAALGDLLGEYVSSVGDRMTKANETNQYRKKSTIDEEFTINEEQRKQAQKEKDIAKAVETLGIEIDPNDPLSVQKGLGTQAIYGVPEVGTIYDRSNPAKTHKTIDTGGSILTGTTDRNGNFEQTGTIPKTLSPDGQARQDYQQALLEIKERLGYGRGAAGRRNLKYFDRPDGVWAFDAETNQSFKVDGVPGEPSKGSSGNNYEFKNKLDTIKAQIDIATELGDEASLQVLNKALQDLLTGGGQPQAVAPPGAQPPQAAPPAQPPARPAMDRTQFIDTELLNSLIKNGYTQEQAIAEMSSRGYRVPQIGGTSPVGPPTPMAPVAPTASKPEQLAAQREADVQQMAEEWFENRNPQKGIF